LLDIFGFAMRTVFRRCPRHNHVFFSGSLTRPAIPSRNLMPPPDLAGNAPITDAAKPVEINFGPTIRIKNCFSLIVSLERFFRQGLHFHEPLFGQIRLHHGIATVAMPDRMKV